MQILKQITENNDIAVVPTGNTKVVDGAAVAAVGFALATGREAYGTVIADAVRTLKGELQLDVEAGIPYLETVFESRGKVEQWKYYVRERIRQFPFVRGVDDFVTSFDGETGKLTYSLVVRTDEGEVTVSG